MKSVITIALASLMSLSATAYAQEAPPEPAPAPEPMPVVEEEVVPDKLSIGASVGMNSPAGFLGLEADYAITKYFAAGLAGG